MKKVASLFLALLMLATLCTASAQEAAPAQWINSTVVGEVTADTPTDPRNDFHLFASKDWFLNTPLTETKPSITTFDQRQDDVKENLLALLEGEPQADHDIRQAQIFYQQYTDMDTRNQLGVSPLLPYMEEIKAISNMEDLSAYLKKEDIFASLLGYEVGTDFADSTKSVPFIGFASLSLRDADEYKTITSLGNRIKENLTVALQSMLELCGYSSEAAVTCVNNMFAYEYAMAGSIYGSSAQRQPDYMQKIYNPVTLQDMEAIGPNLPIADWLRRPLEAGADQFILQEPEALNTLNALYTIENLEMIKDYLICQTVRACMPLLDQASIEINDAYVGAINGMEYHSDVRENAFHELSSSFQMVIGKLYANAYGSEEMNLRVEGLIDQIVAVFRARLETNDWLSEETRGFAIDKLEKLRVRVGYPEDWTPYSIPNLTLKTTEEGGTLLDSYSKVGINSAKKDLELLTAPVDKERWITSPHIINAFYNPSDNSINITSAIISGFLKSENPSDARLLSAIGTVIGHEITHGFDTIGSQFDADGNFRNWWTAQDEEVFAARTKKVEEYYSAIEVLPGKYVDGLLTIGETVADLGGMSCALEIAKTIEDFDYNEFFSSYAEIWFTISTPEVTERRLTDVHAPHHLRTNVDVQQFEEFYQTYDVQPGDGMYLAPEKRLSVW